MTDGRLRKLLSVALAGILGSLMACTYWGGDLERIVDESERDYSRDLQGPFANVSMKDVMANPSAYQYVNVRFDAILNHVGEKGFVPYWTPFTSDAFISFSAWPADAKLWQSDDRARSHPLFFVDKRALNTNINDLVTAHRFSLIRISGKVQGDYELKAWFEVNRVEVIEPSVYTEQALADVAVAKQAMTEKKPAEAIRRYEDALSGIWTTTMRVEIHMTLAHLYEGRGNLEDAQKHYLGVLTNEPDNEEATKGLERVHNAMSGRTEAPQQ